MEEKKLVIILILGLILLLLIEIWLVWFFPIITGIILCILMVPWFIMFTIHPIIKSIIENKKEKKGLK